MIRFVEVHDIPLFNFVLYFATRTYRPYFMCKVSDKIKFCTCSGDAKNLRHFWVLHRFVKGRHEIIMGQPVMPLYLEKQINTYNRQLLLQRLNEPDAFDADISPLEKDRLQVSFQCSKEYPDRVDYGFEFKKGKWRECEYDFFEWYSQHVESNFGKIKSALKHRQ